MKKTFLLIIILLAGGVVFSQSADVITDLLESDEATFGQVSYLAAVQMNLIDENESYENAVKALVANNIIPDDEESDTPIPLVDIAYIYSKLWDVKGGLMYRITKGSPRYAFRQFQSDGVISSDADPAWHVSGAKALSIFTSCVNKYSGFDMNSVSMEVE